MQGSALRREQQLKQTQRLQQLKQLLPSKRTRWQRLRGNARSWRVDKTQGEPSLGKMRPERDLWVVRIPKEIDESSVDNPRDLNQKLIHAIHITFVCELDQTGKPLTGDDSRLPVHGLAQGEQQIRITPKKPD